MKCIKQVDGDKVVRIKDFEAARNVATGRWKYVPKSEFKAPKKIEKLVDVVEAPVVEAKPKKKVKTDKVRKSKE